MVHKWFRLPKWLGHSWTIALGAAFVGAVVGAFLSYYFTSASLQHSQARARERIETALTAELEDCQNLLQAAELIVLKSKDGYTVATYSRHPTLPTITLSVAASGSDPIRRPPDLVRDLRNLLGEINKKNSLIGEIESTHSEARVKEATLPPLVVQNEAHRQLRSEINVLYVRLQQLAFENQLLHEDLSASLAETLESL